jgi:hypothetical protein
MSTSAGPSGFPSAANNSATAASGTAADTLSLDLHEYIWPTDASKRITSSFAEYRTTHFHGGIDISTNQVTGYKVFSVSDGYVYRIVITANGYGKMLYVKHTDGLISTYAHLKTFNEAINTITRREQLRRGTYSVNYAPTPGELPVHQGDVIAYTGNTGFGPPHLHFELRDANLNPVNPLRSPVYRMPDNIPPAITRLMVAPLTYGSTVDNADRPHFFSRFPRSHRVAEIPGHVRVHGDVGIGVEAQDKSDGSWSRAGIYKLELFVDDSCYYRMELDRIPVDETKLIDLHYDFRQITDGHGRFQKLYIDQGNDLPIYYNKPQGTGIIHTDRLTEGPHRFTVACIDASENRTELHGTLFANHRPSLEITGISDASVTIGGKDLSMVAGLSVYGKRAFQSAWTKHTLPTGRFERNGNEIVLPVNTKPYDVIKVVAETNAGSESPAMFRFVKKMFGPVRAVLLSSEILPEYVRISATTPGVFTSIPVLQIHEGESTVNVPMNLTDVNTCSGWYIPSAHSAGSRVMNLQAEVNGKPTETRSEFAVYPIPADRSGSWSFDNGRCTVSFDSGAVFTPLLAEVTTETSQHGTIYSFEPKDVLLNKGIRVTVQPAGDRTEENQALYCRTNGGWLFQTGTRDGQTGSYTTAISRTLGDFTLLEDRSAPAITRLRCGVRSGVVNASFRYFDNLSGIDPDNIKLYLDNTLVIPEIDGEHRMVSYTGDTHLTRGKHVFRITVSDRAANTATIVRNLAVR